MLGWFSAASLGIKIAILVAIALALAGTAWAVQRAVFHWGYDAAVAEYTPKIQKANFDRDVAISDLKAARKVNDEFAIELGRMQALVDEQKKSIDEYRIAKLNAEIVLRKALVDIAGKEKRYTAEIARLLAIASGPTITEGACEEADAILRSLIRDRLREHAGATPS
jgi:hypothetical protein